MFLIPSKSQNMPLVGVKKKIIWSHNNKALEILVCFNKLEYIILIVCIMAVIVIKQHIQW